MQVPKAILSGVAALAIGLCLPMAAQTSGSSNSNQPSQNTQTSMQSSKADTGTNSKVTPASRHFMNTVARDDNAEVQIGKLAQSKAQNQDAKQLADKLVTDHQDNLNKLQDMAGKDSVNLKTQPNAKQKAEKAKLEKLSGKQFDEAFLRDEAREHKQDITKVKAFEQKTNNPDLKSFAQQTASAMETHLDIAQKGEQSMGIRTKPTSSASNPSSY